MSRASLTGTARGRSTGTGYDRTRQRPVRRNTKGYEDGNITTYEIGLSGGERPAGPAPQGARRLPALPATLDELAALNDRELADLGISRLSIRDIAHESVYGL